MEQIEYPVIRINSKDWLDYEELVPLFDGYLYSSKDRVFYDYYYNKEYVDCKGDIYKVVDRVLPTSFWRNFLGFLPGVFKAKLVFKKTDGRIELSDFKNDLINGIRRFDTDDTREISEKWIKEIEVSKSIKEILTGEKDK